MTYRVRDWINNPPAPLRVTHEPRPTADVFDKIRADLLERYPEVFAQAAQILADRFVTCRHCGREFEPSVKQGARHAKFCREACRVHFNDRRRAA